MKDKINTGDGDFGTAAVLWFIYGFLPSPIIPGTKRPALKREPWLLRLGEEKIQSHWKQNPEHEIAAILDGDHIVLDADTAEANTAVQKLMRKHDVKSALIVSTKRGYHYHFRKADGVVCRSQSHDSKEHPERIDVKASGSMIMLPPSTCKKIVRCDAHSIDDLSEVGQEFVDAIFQHNQSQPPRTIISIDRSENHSDISLTQLEKLVENLDPDNSYDDWTRVGMALHSTTKGSKEGLNLFDRWSSRGNKYEGRSETTSKWRSFDRGSNNPVSVGSLIHINKEQGHDVSTVLNAANFEAVENETSGEITKYSTPFHRYSMRGMTEELRKNSSEERYVLQGVALLAQFTLLFGPPNIGKTLLLLVMLKEAIEDGRIDADKVFYINEDDNLNGIITKNEIAESMGIHMLSSGYQDFKRQDLGSILRELIDDSSCLGVILILDTAKKFTNVMDKRESSQFAQMLRRFVKMGGTAILLAHTNKRPNADGTNIPGGTSDLLDDADAGFVLNTLENDEISKRRVVTFTEVKSRGGQEFCNTFQYHTAKGLSYLERLESVERLTDEHQQAMEQQRTLQSDQTAINEIISLITNGTNTKMEIVKQASTAAGISQAKVKAVMDRYMGQYWAFETAEHGKQIFTVLHSDTLEEGEGR